ncbi:hypothetical protein [Fluviispira vulneris]|uniref:hypothetical protein n=1 Tax=Fluviispira vulneris TaxID=2763012 RepID=UPI0016484AC6|nr:hypothetical protein [Fluviispira vulneris]
MFYKKNFKQKFVCKLFMLTFSFFLYQHKTYADEAFVYCAHNKNNWNWLSNKSVKVTGEWRHIKFESKSYLRYFKIDGGYNAIQVLQNKCKKEFGQSYKYAQPADSYFSGWYLFGIDDDDVIAGLYEIYRFNPRIGK